jgi:hypothetical protein
MKKIQPYLNSHNRFKNDRSLLLFEAEVKRLAREECAKLKAEGLSYNYEKSLSDYYKSVPLIWDYEKDCLRD